MRTVLTLVAFVTGPFWLSGCGGGDSTTSPAPGPYPSPTTTFTAAPTPYANTCFGVDPLPSPCVDPNRCNCYHPTWGVHCSEAKNRTHCETSSTGAMWEGPCFYGGILNCTKNGTTTASPNITTTPTTVPTDLWACSSGRKLPAGIVAPEKKGMAVDDTTMSECTDNVIGVWPHASDQITSLRLFAAWKPDWDESLREESWQTLQRYVKSTNAKVLLGTELTFDKQADDQMWSWALDLMKLLGKDHIMGVSVGNEMDNVENAPWDFWQHGFFDMIKSRVDDMDAAGFTDTPITVVWSMGALAGQPWKDEITSFMTQAKDTWGRRWVWSFNPYPIWDSSQHPSSQDDCQAKVDGAISLDYTRNVMGSARDRVAEFVGSDDFVIWVTESGWSSPVINQQESIASICPLWADKETLWTFYKNMMEWDLSLPGGGNGVDHFFYFTMRDACQHGICEGFGLVSKCGDNACKLDAVADFVIEV